MTLFRDITAITGSILALILLNGCFTGVESTPRITYKEPKDANATAASPEEALATTFVPESFSQWNAGKLFFVTSPRISLVLTANGCSDMPTEGDTLRFQGSRNVADLTGKEVVELLFTGSDQSCTFSYRTNATATELATRQQVEVPFTIDLTLLDTVRRAIIGKELFIKTSLWFDTSGKSVNGRKFIKVTIADVLPANEIYPYLVAFTDGSGSQYGVFMSASAGTRWAVRDFPALFAIKDPRTDYPQIADDAWNDIINSRVSRGMTKTEASLALGMPQNVDRGHDHTSAYERWTYADGRYLIFEDGLLVGFNK